ncbi:MAG: hypothetical protein CL867_03005 [Cytophagaceae bacterium]|nr:hypothetical protein [Cytophagaceae bacterium]
MKPKRILMIGPFPKPTTGVSLANQVVREILEQAPGYTVNSINTSLDRFDEKVGSFSLYKLFYNLKFSLSAFKLISQDIIYLTPGQSFFGVAKYSLFILLGSLFKKELVIHVHGNHLGTAYKKLSGWKKRYFKLLVSKMTKGIVLSKSLRPNLSPFLAEAQIFELPNFAQAYLSQQLRPPVKDQLQLVYLSNLMEEKGILVLLEALQMLENENVPYKARIAGNIDADNREMVQAALSKLTHTQYIGVVHGLEKKELLNWGNAFVLPTFYTMEGQPIAILEAMATQNAIVTTAHAGIPDIIKDKEHGYFVAKKDAHSLYQQLKYMQLHLDEVAQIAQNNSAYFQSHFTPTQFEERLLRILKA